ncbi:phage portal protein [Paenibacillaceae bacterium]|nr:phage portal protein [Paenibacillaceae bacterium]
MSDFQAFFAQNAPLDTVEEIPVSPRFKDENGKPIKWKVRSITEEENAELRKASTKRIKGRNGTQKTEFSTDDYTAKMAVVGVVFPDLKNVELQQSYGALGAESLLKKMLLPGEYADLLIKVQQINGFDKDINDLVEDVKN